jgi:hypothetical protein
VDGYINHMVPKNIVFPEKVIEGKAQTRYWSINLFAAIKTGEKSLLDVAPVEFVQVQRFVCQYVDLIIELPGSMKRI